MCGLPFSPSPSLSFHLPLPASLSLSHLNLWLFWFLHLEPSVSSFLLCLPPFSSPPPVDMVAIKRCLITQKKGNGSPQRRPGKCCQDTPPGPTQASLGQDKEILCLGCVLGCSESQKIPGIRVRLALLLRAGEAGGGGGEEEEEPLWPLFGIPSPCSSAHQEGPSQEESFLCGSVYHEHALFPGYESQSWPRTP